MPNEPYKNRTWMYEYYVKKRMNLTDICEILQTRHGITVTPQTLYNWAKRMDLLKYRGKGRNLSQHKKQESSQVKRLRKIQRDRRRRMRRPKR